MKEFLLWDDVWIERLDLEIVISRIQTVRIHQLNKVWVSFIAKPSKMITWFSLWNLMFWANLFFIIVTLLLTPTWLSKVLGFIKQFVASNSVGVGADHILHDGPRVKFQTKRFCVCHWFEIRKGRKRFQFQGCLREKGTEVWWPWWEQRAQIFLITRTRQSLFLSRLPRWPLYCCTGQCCLTCICKNIIQLFWESVGLLSNVLNFLNKLIK